MPTGVALRDARAQLFDAAERVMLRDGLTALTSRAVTAEAGCAKGVLHRYFADFDAFLAELVLDRIAGLELRAADLRRAAGTGSVVDNVTAALVDLFGSVAAVIVGLVISRDAVRARLRETTPTGIPLLNQAASMIASYLYAERDRGRLASDADIETIGPTLIGTAHLLSADRTPDTESIRRVVATVLASALGES